MATEAKCSVTGCEKPAFSKGYCRRHYKQIWRWGKILPEKEVRQEVAEVKCSVAECGKQAYSKGCCRKHYIQLWRTGEPRTGEEKRKEATGPSCSVVGCEKRMHAKGYCRKHYGQIWRTGEIYADEDQGMPEEVVIPRNDADRVRALARELERAEEMYRNVIGFEGRLKWRRELEGLRKDMARFGVVPPGPAAAEAPLTEGTPYNAFTVPDDFLKKSTPAADIPVGG